MVTRKNLKFRKLTCEKKNQNPGTILTENQYKTLCMTQDKYIVSTFEKHCFHVRKTQLETMIN